MEYYVLFYDTVDDFIARRALADPPDLALLVFRSNLRAVAEDFASKDPYVINGLVVHWEVRPWNVVEGNESAVQETLGGRDMIVRLWSAKTSKPRSQTYLEHVRGGVFLKIRGLKGYVGATVLTRTVESEVEILVATVWQSLDAIQQFAGPDLESAVVAEEAVPLLKEFDRRVRHFHVAITDLPGRKLAPSSRQS